MKWIKKGMIFDPSVLPWASHTALQPTPLLLEDRIRIFFGARDEAGVSRIGFVDVDKENPGKILAWSNEPVLDIGSDGCFDENGVVPSAVIEKDKRIYLYYAGYQLGHKVRFSVLGGLAISDSGKSNFQRSKKTPVFERTDRETLFRVPHSVIFENGIWKFWYGGGSSFVEGKRKSLPVYDIRYIESENGCDFTCAGETVLAIAGEEHRLGRPYFFRKNEREFYLFYGYSTEESPYVLGCAVSSDMKNWKRVDGQVGIELGARGEWDSEMMAYPSVVNVDGKIYMFYNGNDYGKNGFGYAELAAW